MSTGVVSAWTTEILNRGMISENETMGLKMQWGDTDTYLKAIHLLTYQPNDFYNALAKGVDFASSKYGGDEFALALGGNEIPGYHTGPAAHVGYLVGSRHSHLDGAGYSIDENMTKQAKTPTPEAIARDLINEEIWRQIHSSLVVCFFARGVYTPEVVSKALRSVEYDLKQDDFKRIGAEILKAKYDFKIRGGFSFDKLRIPKRILETPTSMGLLKEEFLRESIKEFKKKIEAL